MAILDKLNKESNSKLKFEQLFIVLNKTSLKSICFKIVPCAKVINIEASDETMKKRLIERGKSSGRADDNEATIMNRLKTFHECSEPVIEHYANQGKLCNINSEKAPDQVFVQIQDILDKDEGLSFDDGKFRLKTKWNPDNFIGLYHMMHKI